ncbi:MAG TPA: hypothetical protein VF790_12645 [Dissulfurispiraceae bacterium]
MPIVRMTDNPQQADAASRYTQNLQNRKDTKDVQGRGAKQERTIQDNKAVNEGVKVTISGGQGKKEAKGMLANSPMAPQQTGGNNQSPETMRAIRAYQASSNLAAGNKAGVEGINNARVNLFAGK